MSSNRLNDYIRDVFMDLGTDFYPLPLVNVPDLPIPEPKMPSYSFDTERRAIAEYEKDRARVAAAASSVKLEEKVVQQDIETSDKIPRKARSEGILEPSPASTSSRLRNTKPNITGTMSSFEEFEAKPNLFDLVEMHTIDDKAALEEVLLGNAPGRSFGLPQASSSAEPPTVAYSDCKTNGSLLTQAYSHTACSMPSLSKDYGVSLATSLPTGAAQGGRERSPKLNGSSRRWEDCYERLRAKGYSEKSVSTCTKSLPEHLKPQIECYVRSVDTLSRLGANSDSALNSLLQLNFREEKRVLGFGDAAAQLCALGFSVSAVVEALCACGARRDAALERLLEK